MQLLKTFNDGLMIKDDMRIVQRMAVRAIIERKNRILLIHSRVNGDFKFPGGGIEEGEDHQTALTRELLEESGARINSDVTPYGKVVEQRKETLNPNTADAFFMTSFYYRLKIKDQLREPQLTESERLLDFKPVWVTLKKAIASNETVLSKQKPPLWTPRETWVLKSLLQVEQKTTSLC